MELSHRVFNDGLHGFDLVNQTGGLTGQRGCGVHVAAKVNLLNALKGIGPHEARLVQALGEGRFQGPNAGRRLGVEHVGAGGAGVDDGLFVMGMDRALGAGHKAGAHLNRFSAQGKGGQACSSIIDP